MVNKRLQGIWVYKWIVLVSIGVLSCASGPLPAGEGAITLAVWDLEDLAPSVHGQIGMGEILAGQITALFEKSDTYQMVERQHLLEAIEELHLGSSDLADLETRLRLGRIIGARQMVFGGFQTLGNNLRLDLRRVDVASGKILKTASGTAASMDLNGWLQAADEAAGELMAP